MPRADGGRHGNEQCCNDKTLDDYIGNASKGVTYAALIFSINTLVIEQAKDGDELILGELLQRGDHREAANEFGDEPVTEQILRFHMLECFAPFEHGIDLLFLGPKAKHVIPESALDDLV